MRADARGRPVRGHAKSPARAGLRLFGNGRDLFFFVLLPTLLVALALLVLLLLLLTLALLILLVLLVLLALLILLALLRILLVCHDVSPMRGVEVMPVIPP